MNNINKLCSLDNILVNKIKDEGGRAMSYKCAIVTASDEMSKKQVRAIVEAIKKAVKYQDGDQVKYQDRNRICVSPEFRVDEKNQLYGIDPASFVSGRVTSFIIFFSESEAECWAGIYPIMESPILITDKEETSVDEGRIQVISAAGKTPEDIAKKIAGIIK